MSAHLLAMIALTGCPGDDVPVATSSAGGSSEDTGPTMDDGTTGTTPTQATSVADETGSGDSGDSGDSDDSDGSDESSTTGMPVCGNGVVDDGEDCDDRGESATCNDDCTSASCGDGTINATAGEDCDDAGESATCNDDCTAASCGDGTINTTAGEVCDDAGESATCNDDCTTASCGDGVSNATAGEECDDGGESATCDVDCTAASCGDGTFNATAGEECDDAGRSAACNTDCTNASCGDGLVNMTAGEDCDDGGESAVCNSDCSISTCGDGITNVTAGEACDDAGESLMCDTDCTSVSCGDGTVNMTAGEDCDDAGESAACDADCSLQLCGDGLVNMTAGEICDDGGESAACDTDCTPSMCGDSVVNTTAGEDCDDGGESAACDTDCTAATCGDSVINMTAGETCDDGGESAVCDTDCTPALCGDGLVNMTAGETCDDGGTDTQCLPDCTPCPSTIIFQEDFADNAAGWTLDMEWEIGPTAISAGHSAGCGNADPEFDHTPTGDNGVGGVVLGGNASTALHPFYYLTSPVFDASGSTYLELDFWRWLNSDYTPFMENRIEVFDGAAWQIVWQSGPFPGIADSEWTNVVHDITAFANANMQVRIGFNVDTAGVFTCSGWNVDDLVIRSYDCDAVGSLLSVRTSDDVLRAYDPATGVWTDIGPLGVAYDFGELAYDSTTDTLWMIDGRPQESLYTVDMATGAAALVGNHGIEDLFGLAYDPTTNTLYGSGESPTGFYSMDQLTGAAMFIGDPAVAADGLTYDSTRDQIVGLAAGGTGTMHTIDRVTAVSNTLSNEGFINNCGLAYDSASDLYWAIDWSGNLYQYDPNAGYTRTLISSGLEAHDGLTFVPGFIP